VADLGSSIKKPNPFCPAFISVLNLSYLCCRWRSSVLPLLLQMTVLAPSPSVAPSPSSTTSRSLLPCLIQKRRVIFRFFLLCEFCRKTGSLAFCTKSSPLLGLPLCQDWLTRFTPFFFPSSLTFLLPVPSVKIANSDAL